MAHVLGQRIRTARKAAGYRNGESLAVKLNVGARTIARWEAGDTEPSIEQLLRISKLTKKPLAWFLTEEAEAVA